MRTARCCMAFQVKSLLFFLSPPLIFSLAYCLPIERATAYCIPTGASIFLPRVFVTETQAHAVCALTYCLTYWTYKHLHT
ncbi:hypothetical protein F5Y08DRAFT_295514, partial [Xylaria arbuscula]